jgi:predicted nucleic acid-binding protein
VLGRRPLLPAHAAIECYAVLTRLPPPLRQHPEVAAELVRANFPDRIASLAGRDVLPFLRRIAAAGIHGGAAYDALVAETARRAGATLVTRDQRAAATYAAVGVDVEVVTG